MYIDIYILGFFSIKVGLKYSSDNCKVKPGKGLKKKKPKQKKGFLEKYETIKLQKALISLVTRG